MNENKKTGNRQVKFTNNKYYLTIQNIYSISSLFKGGKSVLSKGHISLDLTHAFRQVSWNLWLQGVCMTVTPSPFPRRGFVKATSSSVTLVPKDSMQIAQSSSFSLSVVSVTK